MNRNSNAAVITFAGHKAEVTQAQAAVTNLRAQWAAAVHKHNEASQVAAAKPDEFNKALKAKALAELEDVQITYRLAREFLRQASEGLRMFNMRGKSLNARGQLVRL